jgi:hypothetical protein
MLYTREVETKLSKWDIKLRRLTTLRDLTRDDKEYITYLQSSLLTLEEQWKELSINYALVNTELRKKNKMIDLLNERM